MVRSTCRGRSLLSALALASTTWCGLAQAEKWFIEPALDTRATWTDNVSFDEGGQKTSDLLLEATPSVALRGEGKRFRIFGHVAATGVVYANGTRDNRLLPEVDLNANLEAIERFFFLEAGVTARQTAGNVFAARPEGASDFNTETTTDYRIAPSFEGQITPDLKYRLRSSNDWTTSTGLPSDQNQSYFGDHTFRIERQPVPLGWAFQLGRTDSRFENQVPPKATDDTARVFVTYAFTGSFAFGVHGGYEKTNLVTDKDQQEQTIYGFEMRWRPSERTNLDWLWEERFFGPSWHFRFDHRMPTMAWNITLSRDIESFSQTFLSLPPTNNVAGLLDASFTTRFPDPTERARIVADIIARQGLPSSLLTQTSLSAQRVSVVTSRNVQFLVLGIRSSLVIGAYSTRTEDLSDSVFLDPTNSLNLVQEGGSITISHQATPVTALNLLFGVSRSRGLDANDGQRSYQRGVRFQVTRQLAPKTTGYAGVRAQNFDSNVPGVSSSATEHAAFIGLGHRF
jgi:uncharacterized protein (PEP-CTERM system associated)